MMAWWLYFQVCTSPASRSSQTCTIRTRGRSLSCFRCILRAWNWPLRPISQFNHYWVFLIFWFLEVQWLGILRNHFLWEFVSLQNIGPFLVFLCLFAFLRHLCLQILRSDFWFLIWLYRQDRMSPGRVYLKFLIFEMNYHKVPMEKYFDLPILFF